MFNRHNFRAGIAAAAARGGGHGGRQSAAAGYEEAEIFTAPTTRAARVKEVADRIFQMDRDLTLAEHKPPELWTQWRQFVQRWEDWFHGVSLASFLLPSTEQEAYRAAEQVELFRKAFAEAGTKTTGPGGEIPFTPTQVEAPATKPKTGNPWQTTTLLLLGAGAVGLLVLALAKPKITVHTSQPAAAE
jgi:hypothetical protein